MDKVVLIIENDRDTAEVLEIVVSQLNFRVISKPDIIPLQEVEALNPDLIILDHWLDTGFGADYCNTIKNNPATRHIPVIIVSFIAQLYKLAEDSKADACLNKPFDIGKLELLVKKFVG